MEASAAANAQAAALRRVWLANRSVDARMTARTFVA
jgi:hypothetical protein